MTPEELALAPWARRAIAFLGAGGVIGGAVSVFTEDNGVGSAALLTAGTVILLVALAGRMPMSLRAGDYAVEFAVGKAEGVQQVAADTAKVTEAALATTDDPEAVAALRSLTEAIEGITKRREEEARQEAALAAMSNRPLRHAALFAAIGADAIPPGMRTPEQEAMARYLERQADLQGGES